MRKRKYRNKKNTKKSKSKYILILLLTAIIAVIIFLQGSSWDRQSTLAIVYPIEDTVQIAVLTPRSSEIYRIQIPGETSVEAAHNLGEWKLSSIWQLGYNEDIKGELLAQTVAKNFYFPINHWSEGKLNNLLFANPFSGLLSLLDLYDTNLTFIDKLNIYFYANKVSENNVIDIDLSDDSALNREDLVDGETGYVVVRKPNQAILALFNSEPISNESSIVQILNYGNDSGYIETITQLLWVLGANVASIETQDGDLSSCEVKGVNTEAVNTIAKLINCEAIVESIEGFDIVIRLPENYKSQF